MWTVLFLLKLWIFHSAVSASIPSPTDVVFSSVNLRNVLHWTPGNGTPQDTHYTAQYTIYGDSVEGSKGRRAHWRTVRHCTEIVRTWCDLSNETWDGEHGYHGRVRAVGKKGSSKWILTRRRFDPKSDTAFGPPLMSVELEENNAVISLKGPMRYQPNNHTLMISMATLYPHMSYNLSVRNSHSGHTYHFPVPLNLYKYRLLEHKTEYCFSAKTRFLSMPVQCQPSEWYCITTPQDPNIVHLQRVICSIVVPSLCICVLILIGYFLRNYLTGKGQQRPHILNTPCSCRAPQPLPLEYINYIIVVKDRPPSDTDSAISDLEFPFADPPPRYSPQRHNEPEEPEELEEPRDDSSVDYGFVGPAPAITVGCKGEESKRRHGRGEDGNNLNGKCRDDCEKKEQRDEDGQTPQVASFFSQRSNHTCSQSQMPIQSETHAQTEMNTLVQARVWSPLRPDLMRLLPSNEAAEAEADGENEEREHIGLFLKRNAQTGLFDVSLNIQTKMEAGMGGKIEGKVRGDREIDGSVEETSESDNVALLSAYASQNIRGITTSCTNMPAYLPNDYAVLNVPTAQGTEEDDDQEEEDGHVCIDWDPETGKLMLPEMVVGELMQGEERSENRMREEEEEEVNTVSSKLKLESVYVRQVSEEAAEAQRGMEARKEAGWEEADDIFTKWNLVLMDE